MRNSYERLKSIQTSLSELSNSLEEQYCNIRNVGMKLLMIEENMRQRKMKCIRFMRKFQIVIQ